MTRTGNELADLEARAARAGEAGESWPEVWRELSDDVGRLVARRDFHRTYRRLVLAWATAGSQEPVAPWDSD